MQSKETEDVYRTTEPQTHFDARIRLMFLPNLNVVVNLLLSTVFVTSILFSCESNSIVCFFVVNILLWHCRYCLELHNQAVKALRYPANTNKTKVETIEEQCAREQQVIVYCAKKFYLMFFLIYKCLLYMCFNR